jgi:hypothetical protein
LADARLQLDITAAEYVQLLVVARDDGSVLDAANTRFLPMAGGASNVVSVVLRHSLLPVSASTATIAPPLVVAYRTASVEART